MGKHGFFVRNMAHGALLFLLLTAGLSGVRAQGTSCPNLDFIYKNFQLNFEYGLVNDRSLAKHNYNFFDLELDFRF